MKATSYFINHPVIALVLNIIMAIIGVLCLLSLSVREYPEITFPVINVSAKYPNASPDLIETSVTNVLEDRLAGIEGLETITSQSGNGFTTITLQFRTNTPMGQALNAVQDAVSRAQSRLPTGVKPPSVERKSKTSGPPFIGVSLESPTRSFGDLTHYANLNLKNTFRSLPGVASVSVWGRPYTYVIKLDRKKMFSFGINADDVLKALADSGIPLPAGKYQNQIPASVNAQLKSETDYENLLIKAESSHPIQLKSIATIALNTDDNQFKVRVNGHPGLVLSINRAADANPLEVSKVIQKTVNNIQQTLPDDLHLKIIIDQSDFIHASLTSVSSTIVEAICLVLIIVFLFLRTLRATIIPLVAIPISLLGALIFLKLLGYSLNLMTLLAMVLAIGLVVDDAIIVLENIWRHIENGVPPWQAAKKGTSEIGFAVLAMTCTLISVYLPLAFIEGMLGQLFIEFAIALAGSVFISGIVALTLTPLMCAWLLRYQPNQAPSLFEKMIDHLNHLYTKSLNVIFNHQKYVYFFVLLSVIASLVFYNTLDKETAPKEDRGLIGIQMPAVKGEDITSLDKKTKLLEKNITRLPEAQHQLTFVGEWGGNILFPLKPHNKRTRSAGELVDSLRPLTHGLPSIEPHAWSWDTGLPGIDDAGNGSELELVISTTKSYKELHTIVNKLKARIEQTKAFVSVSSDLHLDNLGYQIEFDRLALAKLGLTIPQAAKTIEVFFSGDKSQSFSKDGIEYHLTVKGKTSPYTLHELYLTNPKGTRISLGALASMTYQTQPETLEHFQQMRSTTLHVQPKKEDALAHSISILNQIANQALPKQYSYSWKGAAKIFDESTNTMLLMIVLSLLFIYAILSCQFENFIDPLIILFTVPLACSGALLLTWLFQQSVNIYTQVGLITLIGLISKHGILIVEFANQLVSEGMSYKDAVIKATSLRFRPILMTTAAMIFGAIPLVYTHNAGAEARHAIGTVLIGGLGFGTLFTLFVLPVIYYLMKRSAKKIPAFS